MVNKVLVVLLLVVVGGTIAGGTYIGFQFAGSASGPMDAESGTTTVTPTPTATPTATPSATPTSTPTPVPSVDPASIDAADVEQAIVDQINSARDDRGLDALSRSGELREMARFHSDNMAEQQYLSHSAGGFNTEQRYERFDLADQCRFADDTNTGTREDESIEVYGRVTVGPNGTDATQLADAAVTNWFGDDESETILTYQNANKLGVGVTITESGQVYLTVDLC